MQLVDLGSSGPEPDETLQQIWSRGVNLVGFASFLGPRYTSAGIQVEAGVNNFFAQEILGYG